VTRLEELERRYREHHATSRPSSFVYGGDARAGVFREVVGGPGLRVLDLGCRSGALTRAYADGNTVVGVDVDRVALEEAAKLGIETRWADVEEPLEVGDASFDVVVAGELLEHLREPARVVAEAWRALRPGGRLVGSVPNAYRLKNRLRFLLGTPPERDPTHLHMFRPADVRGLLRDFHEVELRFVVGRLVALNGRLFANDIVFSARKPD
jgi:2-polyprenyl-3-methyl-5-hydroxy-6-metoxy-1,4-benzoquinol methylase